MGKKRILLIHTGGTIGMGRGADGFVPKVGLVEAEMARLLQGSHRNLLVEIVRFDPLIDSANATPRDWNRISETIALRYADFDGFMVTHGTDTLAYCAAALALALEGLGKPVLLTGAMLPLSETGTDGQRNLSDTLTAFGNAAPGVHVQFSGRLLHGARIRKTHSHAFDAFDAEPTDRPPFRPGLALISHAYGSPDIAVLPVAPGGSASVLKYAMATCDGAVLRCFGSGTVPNTPHTQEALQTAQDRGIPVIAVSQCPEGGMALGTYAAGAILARHQVVDGRDMTLEAAYVKMVMALSLGHDIAAMRQFLSLPLCGEFRSDLDQSKKKPRSGGTQNAV